MEHSEAINELSAALAKAQGMIKPAIKDSANPFFKSNYADLASVWDACRDALSNNGLAVIQTPDESEKGVVIETMLCHSSGQWITSRYVMPVSKSDAQAVGAAITYGRRYALAAMVGVAPYDDDAEATRSKTTPQQKKEVKKLEVCSDEKFVGNATAWEKIVRSGTKSAAALIATISTKAELTEAQKARITSWENE